MIKLLNPICLVNLFTFYVGGGGDSGGGGAQTSTSYSTNLPEYAQPYYQELLKQTGKQTFATDADGAVTGIKPYQPYTGQRIAGFSPEQLAVQGEVRNMATPTGFAQGAAGLTAGQQGSLMATQGGLGQALAYNPQSYTGAAVQGPNLNDYQMQAAQSTYNPDIQNYQMQAAQTGFNPNLQSFQMDSPGNVNARDFTSLSEQDMMGYMNPYQKAVTDVQIKEAQIEADRQRAQGALGAIGRGTFGGARNTLAQATTDTGNMAAIAKMRAEGQLGAYNQAMSQFNTDEGRRLQAQQSNQQANLTRGQANLSANLGVQQLGTETGLRAALANLDTSQQANAQNLAASLQTQGLRTDTGMKTSLANLDTRQQANVQNLASMLQTQGLSADQALRAALANQATQLDYTKLNEQTRQFGAGLGKELFSTGLAGLTDTSKGLGAMAATQQDADLARLQAQSASGAEKQGLEQKALDTQYQQAMEARDWNQKQLEFYSNILRGNAGALGSTQVQYTPAPSASSQIAGLGLAGLGLSKALG